jgi:hypothetical protein
VDREEEAEEAGMSDAGDGSRGWASWRKRSRRRDVERDGQPGPARGEEFYSASTASPRPSPHQPTDDCVIRL